jgi:hypothetical protein
MYDPISRHTAPNTRQPLTVGLSVRDVSARVSKVGAELDAGLDAGMGEG